MKKVCFRALLLSLTLSCSIAIAPMYSAFNSWLSTASSYIARSDKGHIITASFIGLGAVLACIYYYQYYTNDSKAGHHGMQGKRATMEDRYTIQRNVAGKFDFFGVYDGHGGDRAAEFVANNLHLNIAASTEDDYEDTIKDGVATTEKKLLAKAQANDWIDGTCAIFALLENNNLYVANIGDSRAVLSRNKQALALSEDQKPDRDDEKDRIEAAGGKIKKWGVWRTPDSLAVSRALGDYQHKQNNYVIATPEITTTRLQSDDEFLILACDGVWDVMTNQEAVNIVAQSLAQGSNPTKAAKTLTQTAYDTGSTDNISALVVILTSK